MLKKFARVILIVCLIFGCSDVFSKDDDENVPLTVRGLYVVGSAVVMWNIRIFADGYTSAETIRGSKFVNQTNMVARKKRIEELRTVINEVDFFSIPKEIAPKEYPLHSPSATIVVTLGNREHKVSVTKPRSMSSDPNFKKFIRVWDSLIEDLMFKPNIL